MSEGWQPRTLGEYLAAQVTAQPEAEALVTPGARLTWRALSARAHAAAGGLRAMGIAKGDHVAILMPNGEDWITLFYGAALLGAVTVPVNTRFKAAELAY